MPLVVPFIFALGATGLGLTCVVRPMVFLSICQRMAEFGGKDPSVYDDVLPRTFVRLWGAGFAGFAILIAASIVSEWI